MDNGSPRRYRKCLRGLVIGLCLVILINTSVGVATPARQELKLTPEERTWLEGHKEIRLGVDPAWPPIEFISEDHIYQGVTSEYIRIFNEQLKIRMVPLPGLSWAEVLVHARTGKVDLLPAISMTPERSSFLLFTKPYLSFPFVVYTRKGTPFLNGLDDLAGKRVAIESAYAVREMMLRDFPGLELVLVADPLDGLRRLSLGEVDAYTGSLAVGSYLIDREGLANVKVAAPTSYRFELSMGVRKDWPELIPILQKVLDSLSDEEKMAISQQWLKIRYDLAVDYHLVWEVLLGSLLVILLGGLWLLQMRRQKEALRLSEERYHLAMDAVSEAVWEWDLTTEKRYFSTGFFSHLDYSEAEIPDNEVKWQALIHPQDRTRFIAETFRHSTDRDKAEQPLVLEYRVRNKQGEYVDVQSRGKVVKWDAAGNATLWRGTLRDISAQKLVESELHKLSLAVEHSPSMVIITDNQGYFEYVNPKFTDVTGFSSSEVMGQNTRILQSGLTDITLYRDLWTTVSSGKEWRGEIQNRKKNGEIYWESMSISAVRNAQGVITHYVGLKEDITARKEAERLTTAAREQAEQASHLKSDFLANVSHEIRTPMNAIIGLTHLTLQTDLNSKQHNYIQKIKVSAYNLLSLINDILDFSKIEAGKLEIEETGFQLDKLLDNLAGMTAQRAQEKGLEVHIKMAAGVPNELLGDPLRLGQVLVNLVHNAIKFTDQGEVVIAVEVLGVQQTCAELAFTITDTGIGIEPERLPHLFEAFVQADNSTTRQHGGSGLGLTICKQLVDLMAGQLTVESVPGEGSSFRFELKLGLQTKSLEQLGFPATKLPGIRLLLIFEDTLEMELVQEMLGSIANKIFTAHSAEEANQVLDQMEREFYPESQMIDLIVMDWPSSGNNAANILQHINMRIQIAGRSRILLITDKLQGEIQQLMNLGKLDDVILKPIVRNTLLEKVESLIFTDRGRLYDGNHPILSRRLRGKVLLVEDNVINQLVARELLENFGLQVVIACEGAEAIECLHASDIDLVLMDVQMPGMDGYQATRIIRSEERFSRLPIVAMTAYAMVGDERRCLAVGMNDYLSKPVEPERLWEVLHNWLPDGITERTEIDSGLGHDQIVPDYLPGIDLIWLDRLTGGKRQLFPKLFKNFYHYHSDCCERIKNAIDRGDVTEAQRITHTMQGVSGSIGARDLQGAAQALDKAIRAQRVELIEEGKLLFCKEARRVFDGLERLNQHWLTIDGRNQSRECPEDSTSSEKIVSIIDQLSGYLQSGDTEAKVLTESLWDVIDTSEQELYELMNQIQHQVAEYEYDEALSTLQTLYKYHAINIMKSGSHDG